MLTSRKRPFLTRAGCCAAGGPIPRQQVIEPAHRMAVGHAFQNVLEIGERLDVIELCGGQQRGDDRPAGCAAIGSGEQMVLAAERDGPDGAFDRVVVELDAAVIEEAAKRSPAGERIADRIGERRRAAGCG